ncbi:MAG: hypothetical protein D8M58_13025 [Calditrichaeota bacterium]|nr:MAG: hypothetical protein DWQ03_13810 [Calditrichota bacterium]MBL1206322.1 hypothetical protein [Calditrichota bacterium]NOG46148.1 hypothetical protein [Calditrichota bacterium]
MKSLLIKINDWKYSLKSSIGLTPGLYYRLFARSFPFDQMAVSNQTEICIEGFPRSANSYAVVAFKLDNQDVKVGHHLHVPAQIIRAAEMNIPNVVVLRSPEEAVASFLVFQSSLNASLYLKSYIQFHKIVEALADKVLITSFETATKDFNKVIEAVNQKYSRNYNLVGDIENRQDEIITKLKKVNNQFFAGQTQKNMFPDEQRKKLKERVMDSVKSSPQLIQANEIYNRLKAQSI